MIVLNTKTFEELKTEATSDLQAVGFSTDPGGIAKLFLNIVNKNVANLYTTLTVNHLRAFVTTSDGDALDAIGVLLQCSRLKGETDDNYRYRITQQCLTLAKANETAVRLTTLICDGVTDVVLRPYSMGAGTFTVIILVDPIYDPQVVIEDVRTKLKDVHGYGIRYNVVTPELTFIKIKQRLFIKDSESDATKQEIRYNAQHTLSEYLNSLKVGEDIIIDKITQLLMNVHGSIVEEANVDFYINGDKALYVNQSCRWFERFALAPETDSVIIV